MIDSNSLRIRKRTFGSMMTVLTVAMASSAAALEIHVSPKGSDEQPGTNAAPVKSLEAARKLAA